MPSLGYFPLQQAIYEKLTANAPLMLLVSGIYDHVPQGTAFPYVSIGEISANDVSNVSKAGMEYQLNINIWSREAGRKQNATIMELMYSLLQNGGLTVSGKNLVAMRITKTSIQLLNDGWTYQGIMELRVVLIDS